MIRWCGKRIFFEFRPVHFDVTTRRAAPIYQQKFRVRSRIFYSIRIILNRTMHKHTFTHTHSHLRVHTQKSPRCEEFICTHYYNIFFQRRV